jgi:hypothetical protein
VIARQTQICSLPPMIVFVLFIRTDRVAGILAACIFVDVN